MSNIAEGFARRTDKDFSRFLYIALGSVSEVQSQLYAALDLGYIQESEFSKCCRTASETAKLIVGFIKYLNAVGSPQSIVSSQKIRPSTDDC